MRARVLLDVGHGGQRRLGGSFCNRAVGPRGTLEKDVLLDLARRVRRALGEHGVEAQLTRDSDVNWSLRDRAAMCAGERPEAMVSLHFNADRDPETQGSEAWVHANASPSSQALARSLLGALAESTELPTRGVYAGAIALLDPRLIGAVTDACLAEISFLSDPREERRLETSAYRDRLALALARGIARHLGARSGILGARGRFGTPFGLIALYRAQPPADALAVPSPLEGIDVSHHQGRVDWARVAGAGKSYAFVRASEGITVDDREFARNWPAMRTAGIFRGAYHFFHANARIDDEAQHFLRFVTRLYPGDLPPVIDCEKEEPGVTPQQYLDRMADWIAVVEKALGRRCLVYTGPSFWQTTLGDSRRFSDRPLWIAHYTSGAPTVPGGWSDWTFWQNSEKGAVAGVTGNVDLDKLNGTGVDLRALCNLARPTAWIAGSSRHSVMTDDSGHLQERWWDGSWSSNDLTVAAGNAPVAAGDPSGWLFGGQHVVYRAKDGHVIELWYDGSWHQNDLTVAASAPAAEGDPLGYVYGNQHVVYWSDTHMHELWYDGSWHHDDLTATAGAPENVRSDPTACVAGEVQHVIYRGGPDGEIHDLYWDGAWHHQNLSFLSGALAAATYEPAAYVCADRVRVAYRGLDGHIWTIWFNGTSWINEDVSALAGAPATTVAVAGPSAVGSDRGEFVYYRGLDGHLHELRWQGSWQHTDLTRASAAPSSAAPAADPCAFLDGDQCHLTYLAATGEMQHLWFDGSWHHEALP